MGDKAELNVKAIIDEIECLYPHLTRGYSKDQKANILRVYCQPIKDVSRKYWPAILREFHRLSVYVRPANMDLAIEEVLGREYPLKRPRPQKTQHTAFQEMQINESQDKRWERDKREWVREKIQREFLSEMGIVEATLPSVPRPNVSHNRSKAKVVEMRRLP